mmetsp:Transcript_112972/g.218907  ORF Transcript_112972/g.218907 Transcript_112972/m.218907 type:complete len:195 (-) Transcript_112972:223-807(-)
MLVRPSVLRFFQPLYVPLCRQQQHGAPRCVSGGSGSFRTASSSSSSSSSSNTTSLRQTKENQVAVKARLQAQQLLRYQPVAPFRESRQGTAATAKLMVLLLRPTSPSYFRLAAGILVSSGTVAAAHWVLYPMDPLFVMSGSVGAFAYVATVGISHSFLWYAGALPLVLLGLHTWPAYMRSLETGTTQAKRFARR